MTTGMILGKFLPPHDGHVYMAQMAARYADELYVVVERVRGEPIDSALRLEWMRELVPGATMVHLTDENPQDPSEHASFWSIWRTSLTRALPTAPDLVFASESYGPKLAEVLGARFVPVDPGRRIMPISGTAVRNDVFAAWPYLPAPVRAHFARRVCVFGPESTGKSTLAANLAAHFETALVPEYARTLIEAQGGDLVSADIERIALGQRASEDAIARRANRVLICDTDLLSTTIWSDVLFDGCPAWIRAEAKTRRYDLSILCDVDVPWVDDVVRYLPDDRRAFFDRCEAALEAHGRDYVIARGDWDARFETARRAIEGLLVTPPRIEWAG